MVRIALLCLALSSLVIADPTAYFVEKFDSPDWESRWVQSTSKSDYGKFVLTAGKFYGDAEKDKGIQTSQDARFYAVSAKLDKPFSNKGKALVLQFTVKHEQSIDCGGGYIKLFPSSLNPKKMNGDSPYNIMFGPDICGYSTKKVHVILNYQGENKLIKKEIKCKDDELTHLYTLILKSDNTYEVKIDNESVESGKLEDDWALLQPKKIKDPNAKKPEDWDDNAKIDDPEDKKPDGWDKAEHIPDPEAKKPEDWDDEMDGEWEPPMIDNPEFKGEWKPKQIDNPKYKGEWVHPEIDNPDYKEDSNLYLFEDNAYVGFDLWQVKAGTIFDNVLVTDDIDYAKKFGDDTWGQTKGPETKAKEVIDKKKAEEEEKKKKEEEEKKKSEEGQKEEEAEAEEEEEEEEKDSSKSKDEL
ncbi:Calreticulin [Trichoplax sp. H2]|nr:Calreticulin [Trichoplax sp. H2]|eukprot:RDD43644.1 Calreticulin [Trichoplax sp. H2]